MDGRNSKTKKSPEPRTIHPKHPQTLHPKPVNVGARAPPRKVEILKVAKVNLRRGRIARLGDTVWSLKGSGFGVLGYSVQGLDASALGEKKFCGGVLGAEEFREKRGVDEWNMLLA